MKESYEQFFTPETQEFSLYTNMGEKKALELIKKKFENSHNEKENLDFHNSQHTKDVINRTETILQKMKEAEPAFVSQRDIKLGKMAAAFHDTVQNWEEKQIQEGSFSKIIRQYATESNEKASAKTAKAYMQKVNEKEQKTIFTDLDQKQVEEAILATIPRWDPRNKTVIQPNLKKESSYIARALALADLGAAGMDGPEKFIKEGDALFREENLDLKEISKNLSKLSANEKKYYQKRMIDWAYRQILFAQGRKNLFERETRDLPENMEKKVSELFSKFDKTIEGTKEQVRKRKNMPLEELLQDFGYNKP